MRCVDALLQPADQPLADRAVEVGRDDELEQVLDLVQEQQLFEAVAERP